MCCISFPKEMHLPQNLAAWAWSHTSAPAFDLTGWHAPPGIYIQASVSEEDVTQNVTSALLVLLRAMSFCDFTFLFNANNLRLDQYNHIIELFQMQTFYLHLHKSTLIEGRAQMKKKKYCSSPFIF